MNLNNLESQYLGIVDYQLGLKLQDDLVVLAKDRLQTTVLGLQHPKVITLGKRAPQNFVSEFPIFQTNRGGLVTIHSEGQLVIYPVMNIKRHQIGVKKFVQLLLETTQKVFNNYDVETFLDDRQIGLYTKKGKIAFCGLEIRDGVSLHGLSINISNDLSFFNQITSCGVEKIDTDRLNYYHLGITEKDFFNTWIDFFKKNQVKKLI